MNTTEFTVGQAVVIYSELHGSRRPGVVSSVDGKFFSVTDTTWGGKEIEFMFGKFGHRSIGGGSTVTAA